MSENIPIRPLRSDKPSPRPALVQSTKPPAHLSKESKALWREIVGAWVLGPDGLAILRGGLESLDTYHVCRVQVAKDGPTFRSETGQIRAHPAAKLALDNFAAFRQAMRQLGLQPEE
jgi:P27 family predicted phage terminase small subunit